MKGSGNSLFRAFLRRRDDTPKLGKKDTYVMQKGDQTLENFLMKSVKVTPVKEAPRPQISFITCEDEDITDKSLAKLSIPSAFPSNRVLAFPAVIDSSPKTSPDRPTDYSPGVSLFDIRLKKIYPYWRNWNNR